MTLAGAAARGADHEVERLLADGADPRDGGDGVSPLYALARARLGEHTYDFFPYVRWLRLLLEALAERGGDAVREAILAPHGGDATVLHAAAETDWPHEATDRQFKPVFTYGWPTAPIAAAYACSSSVPPLSLSVPDGQGRTRGRWIRGSRRRERSTSPSGNASGKSSSGTSIGNGWNSRCGSPEFPSLFPSDAISPMRIEECRIAPPCLCRTDSPSIRRPVQVSVTPLATFGWLAANALAAACFLHPCMVPVGIFVSS